MPRVWKEVLCLGRQRDRHGNWFEYTPRDIRQADANVSRMLSRGVPVPAVWEHQDVEAGDPAAWKARYAKYTFGHIAGRRVNARGNLELLHDVPDPADVRQLRKTRFVSPKVYPSGYSDSRGGVYRGATIAHVAATPTPVQYWQRPFELSRGDAYYLSYSPEGDMADDADTGDKGEKKDGEGEGGGGTGITAVIEALREVGFNIPEEVTDEAGLVIAIKAGGAPGGGGGDGLDLDDEGGQSAGGTEAAGAGGPMLMSDDRAAGYAKRERVDLKRRVNALFSTGRLDRPTARDLLRRVDAQELSFTRAGDLVETKLVHQVEAYERLPKGLVWSKDGKARGAAAELSTTEVPAPDELTGAKTDPEVIKKQEELARKYSAKK